MKYIIIVLIVIVIFNLIGYLIDKDIHKHCEGCEMANHTKGISCDTCINGCNYGKWED